MGNKYHVLPYLIAKPLIEEGDVLLFRGTGYASYFLSKAGKSPYTHVGIASWAYGDKTVGILECVEFREWKGGRSINLQNAINDHPGRIDVYRPVTYSSEWIFDSAKNESTLIRKEVNLRGVTNTMRLMTGLPYGWKRIWWLSKHHMVGFRLGIDVEKLRCDILDDIVYPVCSTAIAYSFNSNGYDLIMNRADQWTEPADIAMSPRLSYLFTLDP